MDMRRQSLKMLKEAEDDVGPVKTEMSVSRIESRTGVVQGQLPHGDPSATKPRAHPPVRKKPRIHDSPDSSLDLTEMVRSSTKNEAAVLFARRNTVRGLTDNKADDCCSRTETLQRFICEETEVFRIQRELSPVPASRTDPVFSLTNNETECCSRTEMVHSLTKNEAENVHISPTSRTTKVSSFTSKEADISRQGTDVSVSSSTAKETEKIDTSREHSQNYEMRTMAYNKALTRGKIKTAEEHAEEMEKLQKKMEESDHNFQHEGPTGTKLIILLIIKEGGCIANSAPPVEYDDRFAAARSIAGRETQGFHFRR